MASQLDDGCDTIELCHPKLITFHDKATQTNNENEDEEEDSIVSASSTTKQVNKTSTPEHSTGCQTVPESPTSKGFYDEKTKLKAYL